MATELDKLVVKIEADLSDLKKGMAQANKQVSLASKNMSGALKGVNNTLTKIRGSILKFGSIFAVAFGTLALRSIIKTGVEIQGLEIRFNNLFGSVEEGNKAFKQLIEYAGTVPFSLDQIQAGSGSLAVVAKDAEHLRDIMEITGNVAVIAGLDFRTTASQIQRVFAGGLASADIFREKGISQIIRDTGMMVDTVEGAGKAFEAVFSGNGKFGKATEQMADTVEGTFSMIMDTLQAFTIAIAEGFFVELGNSLKEFNEMLQKNRDDIVALGKSIGEDLGEALVFVKENFDLIMLSFNAFVAMQLASVIASTAVAMTQLAVAMGLVNSAVLLNPLFWKVIVGVSIVAGITYLISQYDDWIEKLKELVTFIPIIGEFILLHRMLTQQQGDIGRTFLTMPSRKTFTDMLQDAGFGGEEARRIRDIKVEEEKITELTLEQYQIRAQMAQLQMDRIAKIEGEAFDKKQLQLKEVQDSFKKIGDEVAKALGKAVVSGRDFKDNMVDIFRSVLQQVAELIIQLYIIKPLLDSINASFGISAPTAIGTASATSTFIANAENEPTGSMIFGSASGLTNTNMILGGLNSPNPFLGLAGGGSVNPNMPYMVGERGAEMFVPKTSGNILNNSQVNSMNKEQPIVIEQNLNFATGVSQTVRAEVMNLLPAIQESTMSAIQDARLRGGRFAKDFGA